MRRIEMEHGLFVALMWSVLALVLGATVCAWLWQQWG